MKKRIISRFGGLLASPFGGKSQRQLVKTEVAVTAVQPEGRRGRTKNRKPTRLKAFSLAEVLIVLAIMGILIMLVVPNQTGIATRTKSMEAQQELRMVHNLQYAYFLQFSKYSMDLKELNY